MIIRSIFYTAALTTLLGLTATAQNVGIGTTTPDNSARLEVADTMRGLLIPRMTQTQRNNISPPANGLLIYQTDTAEGFYYYDGSQWLSLFDPQKGWSLTGNSGTSDSIQFLGTTDSTGLSLRTNNTERLHISEDSAIRVASVTAFQMKGPGSRHNFNIYSPFNDSMYFFVEPHHSSRTSFDLGVYTRGRGYDNDSGQLRLDANSISLQPRSQKNVGIRTGSPRYPLDVFSGDLQSDTSITGLRLRLRNPNCTGFSNMGHDIHFDIGGADGEIGFVRTGCNFGSDFVVRTEQQSTDSLIEHMRVTEGGNVGIGTNSPGGKLQVDTVFTVYDNGTATLRGEGNLVINDPASPIPESGIQLNQGSGSGVQSWQIQNRQGDYIIRNNDINSVPFRINPNGAAVAKVINGKVYAGHSSFNTAQEAIDWADNNGFTTVIFPPGNYGSITTFNHSHIIGLNGGRKQRVVFNGADSAHAITMSGNSTVENVRARTTPGAGTSFNAIQAAGSNHYRIIDCVVKDSDNHAVFLDGNHSLVRGCFFHINVDGDKVRLGPSSLECVIDGNMKLGTDYTDNGTGNIIGDNS